MNNDFIGVYPEVFSKEYCDEVVSSMEKAFELNYGFNRQVDGLRTKINQDDMQLFPYQVTAGYACLSSEVLNEFNQKFWGEAYAKYRGEYAILDQAEAHTIYGVKLQRTNIGQGYHQWHFEHSADSPKRIMAWILYLNDVEEGGETEFLYQHKRVKPKAGTVVIFPAGYTHTHRGNPPLSNSKYIATGWIEY